MSALCAWILFGVTYADACQLVAKAQQLSCDVLLRNHMCLLHICLHTVATLVAEIWCRFVACVKALNLPFVNPI
jgi:hypothetical protein